MLKENRRKQRMRIRNSTIHPKSQRNRSRNG